MRRLLTALLSLLTILALIGAFVDAGEYHQYISGDLVHFLVLFVLTFIAVLLAFHHNFKHPYGASFVYALALAGIIELVQFLLPYRSPKWSNLLAGVAGAVLSLVIARLARKVL